MPTKIQNKGTVVKKNYTFTFAFQNRMPQQKYIKA